MIYDKNDCHSSCIHLHRSIISSYSITMPSNTNLVVVFREHVMIMRLKIDFR